MNILNILIDGLDHSIGHPNGFCARQIHFLTESTDVWPNYW
jgi:hypothetical protein